MLYIIYSRLDSDRYPFFDNKREYFEEYVAQKKNCKDLGTKVSSRLAEENKQLIKEIESLNRFKKQYDIHRSIMSVLEKHNVYYWKPDQIAADLDKRLSRTCPEDISSIRVTLEGCVERIKRMEKSNETTDI